MREKRIFGPPGTGKTTQMVKMINDAIIKFGSDNVLVASFTKTAAAELKSRLDNINEDMIGTLHAICYRLIGHQPIAEKNTETWDEEYPNYAMGGRRIDFDDPMVQSSGLGPGVALHNDLNNLRARLMPFDAWPIRMREFSELWTNWKNRMGYIDFTDMIDIALKEFPFPPGGAIVGFFDEVQDFTPMELSLIRIWAKHMKHIVLAGDDDQCIYSFKGSSPDSFLHPPIASEDKLILNQSYRIPAKIHIYSQHWVNGLTMRESKEYKPRDFEGEIKRLAIMWNAPEGIIENLEQYLSENKKIMILASCGYMLSYIIMLFREKGIPFHNPYRPSRGKWNPIKHAPESVSSKIMAYLRPCADVYGHDHNFWTCGELSLWLSDIEAKDNLKNGAKASLKRQNQSNFTGVNYLRTLFQDNFLSEMLSSAENGDLSFLEKHLLKSQARKYEFAMKVAHKYGPKELLKQPKISIGTIHSVKGGETDVVYLFPDLSQAGMEQYLTQVGHDDIIRLFYVGMTRARETLVMCSPSGMNSVRLPSYTSF